MQNTIDKKTVFDKSDLMERLDNDYFLAVELAKLFITDAREKLVSLQSAIEQQDGPEIEKTAHALKGAASNLSAGKVRYIAGLVEIAGKNNDIDTLSAAAKMLKPAIDELIDVLDMKIINPVED